MLIFWIVFAILGSIYLAASIILFFRSKKQCVVSRSPLIVQVSHWSNLSEIFFTMIILYSNDLGLDKSSQLIFWLIESGIQISHYMMGLSYIVRGYRLYFIFNLGEAWQDEDSTFFINRHRASQRWSIVLLFIMITPLVFFSIVIIIILGCDESAIPLYLDESGGLRTTGHFMVIMVFEFLLELALIILIYSLRIVEDEFQMTKELIFVTIMLSLTTIISIFAHINRLFLFVYLFVNVCLMVASSIWPIILSYSRQGSFNMITQEILNSFQLILEHPLTLDTFEKFLQKDSREGLNLLDIYLRCELFQELKTRQLGIKLLEKIISLENPIPSFQVKDVDLDDENCFNNVLNYCLITLEDDYYHRFRISEEFGWLKRMLRRQEIFLNRIQLTSFTRIGNIDDVKSSILSLIKDYSN